MFEVQSSTHKIFRHEFEEIIFQISIFQFVTQHQTNSIVLAIIKNIRLKLTRD